MFAKICTGFEAHLAEARGEDAMFTGWRKYSPKVAVPTPVRLTPA